MGGLYEVGWMLLFMLQIVPSWVLHWPPLRRGTRRPVVLLPGFLGRGLEFWRLRAILHRAGFPVYVPTFGLQAGDIAPKGQQLADYLRKHQLTDCYLIGYSLGGWVALSLPESERWRIRRLITVGVSFQGTWLGALFPMLVAARQILPGSPFLGPRWRLATQSEALINVYAQHDEVTVPLRTCYLSRCRAQVQAPVSGHLNLILSMPGIAVLERLLLQEEALILSGRRRPEPLAHRPAASLCELSEPGFAVSGHDRDNRG
jgi:pimeloyl-ACP methyl ester carboxylesterase